MKFKQLRLQVSVDFLSSYGIALAIMLIAFVAMYSIALSPNNPAVYCTPVPGFNCNFISINQAGILTAKFAQATGSQITINGVACSTQQSGSTDTPAFGNVGVNSLLSYYDVPAYYPPGNTIYSGGTYIFQLNCYTTNNKVASGNVGQPFSGYIWLNYSIPNYGNEVQKIATFSTVYT